MSSNGSTSWIKTGTWCTTTIADIASILVLDRCAVGVVTVQMGLCQVLCVVFVGLGHGVHISACRVVQRLTVGGGFVCICLVGLVAYALFKI